MQLSPSLPLILLSLLATILLSCGGGDDATMCSVTQDAEAGTTRIECLDGTSATVPHAQDGLSCFLDEDEAGETVMLCENGNSTPIRDGQDGVDGESCSLHDNQDGTYTVHCPDGQETTLTEAQPTACVDGGMLLGVQDDGSPVCSLIPVVEIAAGTAHSCAILEDGTVWCWGNAGSGKLGNGDTSYTRVPGGVQVVFDDGGEHGDPLDEVVRIAAGDEHTCVVREDTTVWCWGVGLDGKLGYGSTASMPRAVQVITTSGAPLSGATSITAGREHSCASLANETAWCWGFSPWLGIGEESNQTESRAVTVVKEEDGAQLQGVASVTAGDQHTCAILTDTTARCWGRGSSGRLGNGSDDMVIERRAVVVDFGEAAPLMNITVVALGDAHTCAALDDGTVRCWGSASYGVLGNGALSGNVLTPVDVRIDASGADGGPLAGVVSVSSGASGSSNHNCAHLADGTAWCWGRGTSGQLGNGETSTVSRAVQVVWDDFGSDGPALKGVTHIAAGNEHSCAVTQGGRAWCWGRGSEGQLGDGGESFSYSVPRAKQVTRSVGE